MTGQSLDAVVLIVNDGLEREVREAANRNPLADIPINGKGRRSGRTVASIDSLFLSCFRSVQ